MSVPDEALHQSIQDVQGIRASMRRKSSKQVRGAERSSVREVALRWTSTHRPKVVSALSARELEVVDQLFGTILDASHKDASRRRYLNNLKIIQEMLAHLRSVNMVRLASTHTMDTPPDFSKLISNPSMLRILVKRWNECVTCVNSGAPLAATVMIGGLLEGLLLARVNRESSQKAIFTAKNAPKDRNGQPLALREWTQSSYVAVAHELGWISVAAKDISVVLRDYRNYIHPQKELTHGVSLEPSDAQVLWEVGKGISRQLLN